MQQLTQDLKQGKMEFLEVPFPAPGPGQVLVRNLWSVISPGTEGKTVSDARKGYIAKARARQQEVKKVLAMIRRSGLKETRRVVMNRLEAPSPLGYSCAGEVLAVGEGVTDIKPGDRVACGGAGAWHAEVVAVHRNLCVKVPGGVDMRQAAFTTIAAIAVQGVRRAQVQVGETVAVVGLGLVGVLTVQVLKAAGCRVIAIDLDPAAVEAGRRNGADLALERWDPGLGDRVLQETKGLGADAVILCAATNSTDPVDLAGEIARPRAPVVVVGAVPTGFSRKNYYRKELDLRMSTSYGPGRYDPEYEEKGVDYPPGYVRWTENRNMQSFLDLVAQGKVNIDKLVSHTFDFLDAAAAYDLVLKREEPVAGILLRYDEERALPKRVGLEPPAEGKGGPVGVGFIGCGSFARNILLPAVKGKARMVGVAAATGTSSRYAGKKFGFLYAGDTDQVLADPEVNAVFIATRHNLHAPLVLRALAAGKHVFVEKPLAMSRAELEEIAAALGDRYQVTGDREDSDQVEVEGGSSEVEVKVEVEEKPSKTQNSKFEIENSDDQFNIQHSTFKIPKSAKPILTIGFNRRFAPLTSQLMDFMPKELPRAVQIRVNAGKVPPDHWIHDAAQGGGRIIGEVCHFIDLAAFLGGGLIKNVHAFPLADPNHLNDSLVINLELDNGSVAAITYVSNGAPDLPKERVEVHCGGFSAVLDDFRELKVLGKKKLRLRLRRQDKGHRTEVGRFLEAVEKGGAWPIPWQSLYNSTLATFSVIDSIRESRAVEVQG